MDRLTLVISKHCGSVIRLVKKKKRKRNIPKKHKKKNRKQRLPNKQTLKC